MDDVKSIIKYLCKAELFPKPEKYGFHHDRVKYLGLIISTISTWMNQDKVKAAQNWGQEKMIANGWLNNLF